MKYRQLSTIIFKSTSPRKLLISLLVIISLVMSSPPPGQIIADEHITYEEKVTLDYSTVFHMNDNSDGYNLIVADDESIYIVGSTEASNLQSANGYMQSNPSPSVKRSGFITKLSATGDLIGSTYLGGNDHDTIRGLAIMNNGNIVVAGSTLSSNFPTTEGAYSRTYSGGNPGFLGANFEGGDGFVAVLSANLTDLLYSTYIGGSSQEAHIQMVLDSQDNIIISGITLSNNFPVTLYAIQPQYMGIGDLFISIFSADLSNLTYSTYYGGSGEEVVSVSNYLAVDNNDFIHITGRTSSIDFPITQNANEAIYQGAIDSFVVKLGPKGTSTNFSTYLGGEDYDFGIALKTTSDGRVVVVGSTSSNDFPISNNAFQMNNLGGGCLIVTILCGDLSFSIFDANGSLGYSTYIGGSRADSPGSVDIDNEGNIVIIGITNSVNFPLKNAYQEQQFLTDWDLIVMSFTPELEMRYSTYIAGEKKDFANRIVTDANGNVIFTGYTFSSGYPVTTDTSTTLIDQSVILTRLSLSLVPIITESVDLSSSSTIATISGLNTSDHSTPESSNSSQSTLRTFPILVAIGFGILVIMLKRHK